MNAQYLHLTPESFTAPFTGNLVYFNPDPIRFCLLKFPSIKEIRDAIEGYFLLRHEEHWEHMLESSDQKSRHPTSSDVIRLFRFNGNCLKYAKAEVVCQKVGIPTTTALRDAIKRLSLQEQRILAERVRPKCTAEMTRLYPEGGKDPIGVRFLLGLLDNCSSAADFFSELISLVYASLDDERVNHSTRIAIDKGRARALDMLSISLSREWLLMPLIFRASGLQEHHLLSHFQVTDRWFNSRYRGDKFQPLISLLENIPATKSTEEGRNHIIRNLMAASTYRILEDTSTELLMRVGEVMDQFDSIAMARQTKGMAFRAYNLLVSCYNALPHSLPKFNLVVLPLKGQVTLESYASFAFLRGTALDNWAELLEKNFHTHRDDSHRERRRAYTLLGQWLLTLDCPPTLPEDLERELVNDYEDHSNTLRNFVRREAEASATRMLGLIAKFFDWRVYELQRSHKGDLSSLRRPPNPVDLRFDAIAKVTTRTGSHRKAIHSSIMDCMRRILSEEDWAWPKQVLPGDYGHFADNDTGKTSHVWCPSSAVMLYTLLTVPLRGLQSMLLDSGEGDAYIYDFESEKMVPNARQIPVAGAIWSGRREGLLQVQPSGVPGIPDILGLWISTNKTGEPYFIPWVSDELLAALKMQYMWVRRFARYPDARGRSAAYGLTRATPLDKQEQEGKFFCLFRDPSASKSDLHAPASKSKLYKLWSKLCAETERRINASAKNEHERVRLVDDLTAAVPRARFDIHTLRVSGITDLLDRGIPLNIVSKYVAGHATYMMTLWYDNPSPWTIRQHIVDAKLRVGAAAGPIPAFSQDELEVQKKYLIGANSYVKKGLYTGFDALVDNKGLAYFKLDGICPGTSCDEGMLDEYGRPAPVPRGDRGPSCPQCRFFLTGPGFALGQMIEGNRLILKLKAKIDNIHSMRQQIMDAEDNSDLKQAELLIGQVQKEELTIGDMMCEWWHRVQLFQASIEKLGDYERAQTGQGEPPGQALITMSSQRDVEHSLAECTDLDLKLFLSTCSEILPEFRDTDDSSRFDIETAIGKFLAINDADMLRRFFRLSDTQRHTSANLMLSSILSISDNALDTANLLSGDLALHDMPGLTSQLASMLDHSQAIRFVPVTAPAKIKSQD